ncbi:MAG: hypothetical protein AB1921_18620, partial [Thermodesulfobacteriota bacterium]
CRCKGIGGVPLPAKEIFGVIMGTKPRMAAFSAGSKSFAEKREGVRGRGEKPAFSKGVFPPPPQNPFHFILEIASNQLRSFS